MKLIVGVGQLDGFGAVKVMNLFRDIAGIRRERVGKIECQEHRAFVFIDNEDAGKAIAAFRADPEAPAIGYAPLDMPAPGNYKPKKERAPRSADGARNAEKSFKSKAPAEKKRKSMNYAEKLAADIKLKERSRSHFAKNEKGKKRENKNKRSDRRGGGTL